VDFVSRFTERIGSRTSREVACKKKKGAKRGEKKRDEEKKKKERKRARRKKRRGKKYGYFSIVIHRARISNYNDGWGKRLAPSICVCLCEKFAGRGSSLVARLPVFSAEDRAAQ